MNRFERSPLHLPLVTAQALLLLCICLTFSACGGIADSTTQHQLAIHLLRHGQPVVGQSVTASIRTYSDLPFHSPQIVVTDTEGSATFAFRERWSSAFLIIPPLGRIPPKPPKPDYLLTLRGKDYQVTPNSLDATYRWAKGSWHTEATLAKGR